MGRPGAKRVQVDKLIERRINKFLSNILQTDSCWKWLGKTNKNGCPSVLSPWTDKPTTAARIVYKLFVKEPPLDCLVKTKCNTPYCLNPEHLYLHELDNEADYSSIFSAGLPTKVHPTI